MTPQLARDTTALRFTLLADAAFCGLLAVACMVGAPQVPGLLGVGSAALFVGLGGAVLVWTGFLVLLAQRLSARWAWVPILGNGVWALGSAVLLATGVLAFTPLGAALVAGLACIVAGYGLALWLCLRGARRQ